MPVESLAWISILLFFFGWVGGFDVIVPSGVACSPPSWFHVEVFRVVLCPWKTKGGMSAHPSPANSQSGPHTGALESGSDRSQYRSTPPPWSPHPCLTLGGGEGGWGGMGSKPFNPSGPSLLFFASWCNRVRWLSVVGVCFCHYVHICTYSIISMTFRRFIHHFLSIAPPIHFKNSPSSSVWCQWRVEIDTPLLVLTWQCLVPYCFYFDREGKSVMLSANTLLLYLSKFFRYLYLMI